MKNKLRGGLWGLLIGDALGVPYEFRPAAEIPPYAQIEMIPPEGYAKTYPAVAPGTWSDDGALALCLLDSLLKCGLLDLYDFADKMYRWYNEGLYAVDGRVFDVGIQTASALTAFAKGASPRESGNIVPNGKGNGALMRVLPAVLWAYPKVFSVQGYSVAKNVVVDIAHMQCLPTHAHPASQMCCALYCLVCMELLNGAVFQEAYSNSVAFLRTLYKTMPAHEQELEFAFRPDIPPEGNGSGFVMDSLRSAFMILSRAKSYEDAVKQAVSLGNDTDTTACITGGAAGLLFGYDTIPERWKTLLRGQDIIKSFEKRLLES